ncbi:YihY/virulence factor BrkB family protein [Thauera sp.]|jgi:membrane protein|uniref:YihY/virulence factor BrkB family protein n=1 Tax=Thauera sp. TaxID=1905334 RepID=UPI0026205FF0|nr:YihY/virulence factor BrkB family protein [Thauera sp.]MCK6409605.1 YihY/virulence factor BrkB family protein [Thauera sp.]
MAGPIVSVLKYWFAVIKTTVTLWLEAQVFVHAAALAFFTVFSVAPVVIVAVTLVGLVLGESAAQGRIAEHLQVTIGPEAAAAVQTAVENSRIQHSGLLPTIAGFAAILFGATTVFTQMQDALNAIWGVAPRPTRSSVFIYLKTRLLSLAVVLGIGFVLLVSLTLSVFVRGVITFAEDWLPVPVPVVLGLDWAVSLTVITLLFGTIFRVLPDVVLKWRDVLLGAFVTALLFTLGRALIAVYLSTTATASTYGAAGSLVLLLLWVNYSSLILLFGAAFTRAHLQARGRPVRPRATAICVHRQLIED